MCFGWESGRVWVELQGRDPEDMRGGGGGGGAVARGRSRGPEHRGGGAAGLVCSGVLWGNKPRPEPQIELSPACSLLK